MICGLIINLTAHGPPLLFRALDLSVYLPFCALLSMARPSLPPSLSPRSLTSFSRTLSLLKQLKYLKSNEDRLRPRSAYLTAKNCDTALRLHPQKTHLSSRPRNHPERRVQAAQRPFASAQMEKEKEKKLAQRWTNEQPTDPGGRPADPKAAAAAALAKREKGE